jgi:hypothetical protein
MRHIHRTQLARAFTIRYWTVVGAVLGVPVVLIAAVEASRNGSPLSALTLR